MSHAKHTGGSKLYELTCVNYSKEGFIKFTEGGFGLKLRHIHIEKKEGTALKGL
jgi:hypothetical protein